MSYCVLIADDSAIVRSMVRKSLAMAGLDLGEVLEATNGREALEQLKRTWVDVVFADINMPEMTGLELVQAMKNDEVLAARGGHRLVRAKPGAHRRAEADGAGLRGRILPPEPGGVESLSRSRRRPPYAEVPGTPG
jgi:two-component system chemotaxis response regulator CheY